MLISFKVENFASIREEQSISMVASSDDAHPENLIEIDAISPLRLLRSVAVYGANASGKSNFLNAIDFVKWMVTFSQTRLESKDSQIEVNSFALDPAWIDKPSRFETNFVSGDVRVAYSFTVDRARVHEEWLTSYPQGRPRNLFVRKTGSDNRTEIQYGQSLKGTKEHQKTVTKATRRNSLVLSAAAQSNFEPLQNFYDWFSTKLTHAGPDDRIINLDRLCRRISDKTEVKRRVLNFLSMADMGIVDINAKMLDVPDEVLSVFRPEFVEKFKDRFLGGYLLSFVHETEKQLDTALLIENESRGTQNFLALLGPTFDAVDGQGVLAIDELSASLHPHVARKLIEYFHARSNVQLIFVSHDTALLDAELLRRDQIWLVEKDKSGATHIYPLNEYRPRKGENLARGYLQGRYGAIPLPGTLGFEDDEQPPTSLVSPG